jgi:hypothetical protein
VYFGAKADDQRDDESEWFFFVLLSHIILVLVSPLWVAHNPRQQRHL